MDERFMVTVFIARAELQMAIEKKTQIVLKTREDQMLVVGIAGKNNIVGVDVVFGGCGDSVRFGKIRRLYKTDQATNQAPIARSKALLCLIERGSNQVDA